MSSIKKNNKKKSTNRISTFKKSNAIPNLKHKQCLRSYLPRTILETRVAYFGN